MPNKINPRAIELAKRQGNEKIPSERAQPVASVQQNSPLLSNAGYSFLEGDFGRQILEEYTQLAQGEYQNVSALQKLSFVDNVVKGSNSFAFVLLNKILTQKKMRIATPADLERCLRKNALDLNGTYGDSGLVLRSEGDPNEYLARHLASQVKEKGYNVGGDTIMIPLTGLELRYDADSPYKLSFQLTDSSEVIYSPQLNQSNNGEKFNEGDSEGLPIFKSDGTRTLYTENGGLRRLYRDWDLDLDARDGNLASSNENGRVVVCAEGTSPKK